MEFISHRNLFLFFLILCSFFLDLGTALDAIKMSQFIKDPETVSSKDDLFKLGFFSPENSTNRHVGIWYLNQDNVIWVANREQPLKDSSGIVTISEDGNLVVLNGSKQVIWSSNVSTIASNSTAQLLDTGNLILQDNNTGKIVWESFQCPSDTFMPNMSLSTNKITGKKVELTSWKKPSDPSIGSFSASLEPLSAPEVFIWNQTLPYWRSGPWNGRKFLGLPEMYSTSLYGCRIGSEENGTVHLTLDFPSDSQLGMFVLTTQGQMVETNWDNNKQVRKYNNQQGECYVYGFCGTFGSCDSQSSPICRCLRGFEPRNVDEWNRNNWTSGCDRKAPLQCERAKNGVEAGKEDGFLKLRMTKVPDFAQQSSVSEDTCRSQCLQSCSCIAYAYDAGIRCMSWSGNLTDIVRFSKGGVNLYIRVASSELDKKRPVEVIITVVVIVGTIIVAACAYFLWAWTKKHSETDSEIQRLIRNQKEVKLDELPLIDYEKLVTATNNFHSDNMLGKGGFGPVYKGELKDGQEIAVKRLSKASGQGLEEFMNEVVVISKLQHRNLVKLLGCCVKGEEKILIYEFMPNKSLDKFLFDRQRQKILDWKTRFNIIEGITRGLIYLHKDSRLRIIHRDLKASNILLDGEMNPKISDFGLARIFKGSEDEANTRRVVGTYGYMSPEYVMKGHFSEKSDVYSFGVLLLETLSGRKNTSFYNNEHSLSLIGFALKLWNEDNIKPFIDHMQHSETKDHMQHSESCLDSHHPMISDTGFENQILRCLHIGLLCVQELAAERPSMTTVLSMLNCEIVNLPPPMQVAFVQRRTLLNLESSPEVQGHNSANNVTLSDIQGR